MSAERQIKLLAEALDAQGKAEQPITAIGTRAHLRRSFKAATRGGALRCGQHEIQLVKRAKKGQLQSYDWVEEAKA